MSTPANTFDVTPEIRSEIIQLRLTPTQAAALDTLAKKAGVSRADWMRRAFDAYAKSKPRKSA